MIDVNAISVRRSDTLREALSRLDSTAFGLLLLITPDNKFERTVTDGDLRRMLLQGAKLDDTLEALERIDSIVVDETCEQVDALALMNRHAIDHLPVVDRAGQVIRVLDRRELDEQILLSSPHMGPLERVFVNHAFETNWIAPLGPNVDAFEREVGDYIGMRHTVALSSGTAAIHLALRLLNIGPGDTVFCSTLTFVASANPIIYQGAEPVFIDSEPESWNMSPKALEKAFQHAKANGRMPKAVVVVNLYGQSADMDPIAELCRHYGVSIVEDAAESLGAKYKGKASGTFGVMGVFSFNGNKIITTSGGGMLVSDNEDLMKRARFLSTQARDPAPHYQHTEIGYNYRLSNILAGVGRGQIRVLPDRIAARRGVFERYREQLADLDQITWMPEPEWSFSTHWLSACLINPGRSGVRSGELIRKLAELKIEARPLWKPMHLQPVFERYPSFHHGETSLSAALFEDGVCLPSGSNMTSTQLDRTIEAIRKILRD